jgi:hypothetical protein
MSHQKPAVRRYSLREERRRMVRENPNVELVLDEYDEGEELPEGYEPKVIEFPPATIWGDEVLAMTSKDPIGAAKLLVGEDDYAAFVESGGSASLLFTIAGKTDQGADVGESDSSASS